MPFSTVADLPPSVTKRITGAKARRQWMHIWNGVYQTCTDKGGAAKDCESRAYAEANGVVKADDGSTILTTEV